MITSRQEFFRLLLEGRTLAREELETGIKYFLKYNNDNFVPYECIVKNDYENTEFEWLSYYTIEEACEWLFTESMNYDKWKILENE